MDPIIKSPVAGHDPSPHRRGQDQVEAVVDRTPVTDAVLERILQ